MGPRTRSAAPDPSPAGAAGGRRVRATWVWDRPDPARLTSFATRHRVRDLRLHVGPAPTGADRRWLGEVASLARVAGQRLWALGGDPTWAWRHEDALAWQRSAQGVGVFHGAHLDVEPHALPQWEDPVARGDLVAGHVALLAGLRAAGGWPVAADLPFWADEVDAGPGLTPAGGAGSWLEAAVGAVDAVTVMSYRDSAAGILQVGAAGLAVAAAAGVPVWLAAETVPLADCPHCTFAGRGAVALTRALDAVDRALVDHPAYAGTSVHHASAWMTLPRGG